MTADLLDNRRSFLWTSGYAARIDTYLGPETPNPLFITVRRASGDFPKLETVACNYSDSLPVTIRFADKVGEVLVMGSAAGAGRRPFKFYV